jgi:type I restriction enzyme M protein
MANDDHDLNTTEGHERFNAAVFGTNVGSTDGGHKASSHLVASLVGGASAAKQSSASNSAASNANGLAAVAVAGSAASSSDDQSGQTIGAAVLKYKSLIWSTADTLLGCGIKSSDFPRYMAPFFALALVESRIKRLRTEKLQEYVAVTGRPFDDNDLNHVQWLQSNIQNEGYGYHPDIARLGIGIADLVRVKTGNFVVQLESYLKQFDPETRRLLGVDYAPGQPKFLDIKGVSYDLASRPNDPLFSFCAGSGATTPGWAAVDLIDFDNSEVTTLEEHIKRMWADISAETAGEQYTPKDVIELACSLGIEARRPNTDASQICDVYDMACGGGNFVFAGEEALRREFPGLSVRVRGQELNDALYALAALEARFRPDAKIEWGNTLTHDHFLGSKFGFIVANPPYGVDWKAYASEIKKSNCGRFDRSRMPPTSDGQLLFLQHAVFHLEENGVGAIVHSGSTLFSGDAGGGESETRRWLFQEQDVVEAIVQLPKNEFFNTGISTYLWILNRNKPADRKGKVLMINAEACFKKLRKNLNMKNCEIDMANRVRVLDCFKSFTDSDISKVMPVDDLLYNKVTLELHRHDEDGRAVKKAMVIDSASVKQVMTDGDVWTLDASSRLMKNGTAATATTSIATTAITASAANTDGTPATDSNATNDATATNETIAESVGAPEPYVAKVDVACLSEAVKDSEFLSVELTNGTVWSMQREEHRVQEIKPTGEVVEHGFGVVIAKLKIAKAKGIESLRLEVSVEPFIETDTETIPYTANNHSDSPSGNDLHIDDFISKWVRDPSKVKSKVVGSEANFNRIFPKVDNARSLVDILTELDSVDTELLKSNAVINSLLRVAK